MSAAPASADVISVFDVSGLFDDDSSLEGTLDIDKRGRDGHERPRRRHAHYACR
jgi:hypothetical protein